MIASNSTLNVLWTWQFRPFLVHRFIYKLVWLAFDRYKSKVCQRVWKLARQLNSSLDSLRYNTSSFSKGNRSNSRLKLRNLLRLVPTFLHLMNKYLTHISSRYFFWLPHRCLVLFFSSCYNYSISRRYYYYHYFNLSVGFMNFLDFLMTVDWNLSLIFTIS